MFHALSHRRGGTWGLDFVGRYQAVAYALEKVRRLLADLHLERYWGDYAL
jgi:hypothetical protein